MSSFLSFVDVDEGITHPTPAGEGSAV